MLSAWKALQRLKRDELALQELPMASHSALLANINRDPKKGKPFAPEDFALFREPRQVEAQLTAEVAATALALRHEQRLPPIVLAAWPHILASANDTAVPPSIRALHSDDQRVWVLCPSFEGPHVRGALVAVHGTVHGPVVLRDIDRSLATYAVQVPRRPLAGWLEGGLLLLAATSEHGHPCSTQLDCRHA